MQTWYTTITDIQPIPNKDRIVLATVNGFQAIVGKDTYQVGDEVVYISEASIVPEALQEELGLVGRLAGSSKDRVKAIKMGGVVSQGIICRPSSVWGDSNYVVEELLDSELGITKYEPQIPIHLSGKVGRPRGNSPINPMYDIENIKKMRHQRWEHDPVSGETVGDPWWFDPFNDKYVTITEKLHGTNFAVHMNRGDDYVYVYSKGLGKQGHVLLEDENNTYWRALKKYPQIIEIMRAWQHVRSITVRGEIIGQGIQDLTYGVDFDLVLFATDYRYDSGYEGTFVAQKMFKDSGVPCVPVLWEGVYDYDKAVELSLGKNLYGTPDLHVREGVVVSCADPYRMPNGQRYAAKFINPDYLTRKGGTEYN
ncbi:RNA ligase [Caudoviricetes sp.]|nr:RNA ligase [Caudoviricetes sp.]